MSLQGRSEEGRRIGHSSVPVVTEFNPDHGAEDGSTTDALVRGLVGALTG